LERTRVCSDVDIHRPRIQDYHARDIWIHLFAFFVHR
jgi:hypothetical protein